jgi:hypothetical protein
MAHRMKSELPPLWNGKPRFPKRVPHALETDHSDSAREAYAKLTEYARSRRAGLAEGQAGRMTGTSMVSGCCSAGCRYTRRLSMSSARTRPSPPLSWRARQVPSWSPPPI